MATISFTSHLQTVAPRDPVTLPGGTVADLLAALDGRFPLLRSYVLDDQGRVRKHVAIFIDGALHPRETVLAEPVGDDTEIYVLQALSGG